MTCTRRVCHHSHFHHEDYHREGGEMITGPCFSAGCPCPSFREAK